MSHALYTTRLFWDGRRGIAKLHGRAVVLTESPVIGGVRCAYVDYAPESGTWEVLPERGERAQMTAEQIKQCDEYLRETVRREFSAMDDQDGGEVG